MTEHPMVRSWYYKACCSGCGNVSERGPFVARHKPDDVVEIACQVCTSAQFKALVEQRDRLWKELFGLVEAVQKPGFESVLETAKLLPGCRAVLASSGERGK